MVKGSTVALVVGGIVGATGIAVVLFRDKLFPPKEPINGNGVEPVECPVGFHEENGVCVRDEPRPEPLLDVITGFSFSPQSGIVPLTVGFQVQVGDPRSKIVWFFGDGFGSDMNEKIISHRYNSVGVFSGSVIVTAPDGRRDTREFSIAVDEDVPPPIPASDMISSFFQSSAIVIQGSSVLFSISLNEPSQNIKELVWSFGDGKTARFAPPNLNLGLSVDHFYTNVGTFSGRVTVNTLDGRSDSKSFSVTVQKDPTLAISVNIILSGFFGRTIEVGELFNAFANISGGISPFDITWDMGDGTILKGFDISHSYKTEGLKVIKLTVVDSAGTTSNDFETLDVGFAPLQVGDLEFINAKNWEIEFVPGSGFTKFNLRLDAAVRNNRLDRNVSDIFIKTIVQSISSGKTLVISTSQRKFFAPGQIQTFTDFIGQINVSDLSVNVVSDLNALEIAKDLDVVSTIL